MGHPPSLGLDRGLDSQEGFPHWLGDGGSGVAEPRVVEAKPDQVGRRPEPEPGLEMADAVPVAHTRSLPGTERPEGSNIGAGLARLWTWHPAVGDRLVLSWRPFIVRG